jgi:hypothetical protein
MEKKNMICFDLDGTIVDLYGVDNWLEKLQAEDATPYLDAKPMWNMNILTTILRKFQKKGWEIQVITWLSKNSSESYKQEVRKAKRVWLEKYNFPYDHFHGIAYGATKADSVRKVADYAILIDDNQKVRNGWTLGDTIDPTKEDLIKILQNLLDND